MRTQLNIEDLKSQNLILLEAVSGSQAYGLATPESDVDIKDVFYLPKSMFYANEFVDQVNNETNDIVYYEIGKYIELLCKNNPNILELLCTPEQHVLYKHPLMNKIIANDFLSKLAKETFAGYAMTQIKKAKGLNKKFNNPVDEKRLGILDFCFIINDAGSVPIKNWLEEKQLKREHCGLSKINHTKGLFALYYDENASYKGIAKDEFSNEVSFSSIAKTAQIEAYLFFNQEAYSAHCKNYAEYWSWMEKRNEARYKGNQAHGKGYDAKNMMHTIRLLQTAKDLFKTGTLLVERPNRDELLAIKNGDKDYDDLLIYTENLMQEINLLSEISKLMEYPNKEKAKQLLIETRTELYK